MFSRLKAYLFPPPEKEPHLMQHFSREYFQSLHDEYRLIVAAINELQNGKYTREHSLNHVGMALDELRKQRVMLEAKINVLHEFLN